MFCTECGHVVNTGDKFCSSCGTPVKKRARTRGKLEKPAEANEKVEIPVPGGTVQEQKTGDANPTKGFAAFLEMWCIIAQLVRTESKEGKRECRREAKLRMYRAPILTIACPVTSIALFVLSIILDIKTKIPVFGIAVVAFAMISFFIVFFFLCIFFTKLKE